MIVVLVRATSAIVFFAVVVDIVVSEDYCCFVSSRFDMIGERAVLSFV